MRGAPILLAAAPVAAALAALATVAATGLSQRSGLPSAVEPFAYGFFLDRYPLFAFAIVYGLVRIVCAAAAPGPASPVRRAVFGLAGLALLLGASLYPTFGGLVLRAGFGSGSMAFLTNTPLWASYAIGSAVAALLFGLAMGIPIVLATLRRRAPEGFGRRVRRAIATMLLSFLALWLGAAILGLAREAGIGPWPRRPFATDEALRAALVVLAATVPHALVSLLRAGRPEPVRRPSLKDRLRPM
ncbi:hypothetical protein [Methylobacterium gregans]|uniref:Uncharacterized protein n=1 Tax=Methylobacterium gregans TaxID=374424 RepID=A0AA37HKY9_9HYPH|nr:hypothetical protein [Methylobacterium gregans]MDQ0523411.1 hypothetical protein [Methylobacterium gregans]GJD77276.1 hypothetical protein NBEOAGPD_0480 [Methylobacterium gregans]GLS55994.1 hypothetical protein GCM10007886_41790 [Methylobacterium gregans]